MNRSRFVIGAIGATIWFLLSASSCSDVSNATVSSSASAKATSKATSTPEAHPLGTELSTDDGQKFTVYSYGPVNSGNQFIQPSPGKQYAAIDVKVCAGKDGGHANPYFFSLQMPDDTREQSTVGVKEPPLNDTTLAPDQCVRGWVTYETPKGATPKFVWMEDGSHRARWDVS